MTDSMTSKGRDPAERDETEGPIGEPHRVHRVSPWPPFVAVGFAMGEIGIVMNLVGLSIGGILLFGGSVAGILTETEYVRSPWRPLVVLGILFLGFGGYMWATQVPTYTIDAFLSAAPTNAIAMRGEAIVVGGALLVLGAIGGIVLKPFQTEA